MIRQLKNISAYSLHLTDFQGTTLDVGSSIDGLMFGTDTLRNSASVASALLASELSISDGFTEYFKTEAVDLIRGSASQVTRDGKPIITTSDRPKDHLWYLTSVSDNMQTGKIGEGRELKFSVAAGATASIDMQFTDSIYIKEGTCNYLSSSNDSYLNVSVVCPAGIPMPAKDNNGNYDLVEGTWTPNGTHTGAYFILAQETIIQRFVNKLPLPSFLNSTGVSAPESDLLPSPYILRITAHNGEDATAKLLAVVHIGCYRKATIN